MSAEKPPSLFPGILFYTSLAFLLAGLSYVRITQQSHIDFR